MLIFIYSEGDGKKKVIFTYKKLTELENMKHTLQKLMLDVRKQHAFVLVLVFSALLKK